MVILAKLENDKLMRPLLLPQPLARDSLTEPSGPNHDNTLYPDFHFLTYQNLDSAYIE